MKCRESEEILLDYLDGTLDTARRQAVEQHVDACPLCAERLASHKAVDLMLSARLAPPQLRPGFAGRLQDRVREAPTGRQPRWMIWLDVLAWGSVGVAGLLALRLFSQIFGLPVPPAELSAAVLGGSAALVAWVLFSVAFDFRLSER